MTAAYTNELISQDQNAEKTNAVVNKRSGDKKDQMQIEDTSEFTSTEMPKSATGGRNHEEDFTDKKNGLPLTKIFIEKDDDTVANEKSSDCSELLEKNDKISLKVYVDEIDDIVQNESKKKELDNCGTCATKFSSKSMVSSTVCTFLGENGSQDTMLETRGVSSSRKDNFELQEIQNCIGNIATEINNFNVKIRNGLDGITLQDNVQETGDSQSELSFHEAVRAGDVKYIETLLASNSVQNLDEPDWNVSGDPPLLVAATNHCLPVLSLLLANGCDPAVRSPRGETALHRVILNGGPGNVLQFVKELIKYGCPAGVKEAGGGLTALHILSRQLAHAQGSKNLQHNFETALKTLDMLARAGPVNAKDHQGRNALHILASSTVFDNNHTAETKSLIETLLTSGADPSLKNDRGETPLHESLECGALNTAFLLIPHTPTGIMSRYGETPLHIASRKNYTDMVEKLLEHGEDPSVQDAGGNTPLHLASARGFHQTVSLLVTSPLAQLEQLNTEGLTALQVAAESGFVNAVRLLLKAGADPSQTVHYCNTILHRHPDITVLIDHELSRRRQLAA